VARPRRVKDPLGVWDGDHAGTPLGRAREKNPLRGLRHSELRTVLEFAARTASAFQVISIRRRPLRSHLPVFTDAQHELLTKAMAAGYFAVPRGITLTELARRLDRRKSGISEAIAIVERKLLESALRANSSPPDDTDS
jgi:predicted DNA binding protein